MVKDKLRRTYQIAATILAIGVLTLAATGLAIQFRIHISNEWQQFARLPKARVPARGDTVLVFAPHSDDETLGCGGMLAMAARNGAKVRVVLVTNGDAFKFAAYRAMNTFRMTPDKYVFFAYRRQQETIDALRALGVKRESVMFLGYPDRGTARMWDMFWGPDKLYHSRTTDTEHSPYKDSFTPDAPYCGESLMSDVEEIIRRVRPTDVYLPHPDDNHPDHYATYCFVSAALRQLEAEGESFPRKIREHTYLVHRGDWPIPRGNHPDVRLSPPHALVGGDTKWYTLDLPPDIAAAKVRAIKCYRTQTAMEPSFMYSFARGNEIFGDLPQRRIAQVAPGAIKVDGKVEDWPKMPPAIIDPIGDYVMAGMTRGGDVRSVYLCKDNAFLYIRVDCVKRLSRQITYVINLRGLNANNEDSHCGVVIRRFRSTPADAIWAVRDNVLEVAVPLYRIDFNQALFVQVRTTFMKFTVDDTGWQEIPSG